MFEGIQNRLQKEITEMAGSVVKVGGGGGGRDRITMGLGNRLPFIVM